MHINSDRLIEPLTRVELLHIENCTQCKIEREKLIALKISANQFALEQPPAVAWHNIQTKLSEKQQRRPTFKQFIYASAASIFMLSVGWLMWNSYNLQQQLEEVLLVNMMLEDKLNVEQKVTFRQATLVTGLQKLDLALYQAKTTKEKLIVLEKRRELINKYLTKPKRNEHEFSI